MTPYDLMPDLAEIDLAAGHACTAAAGLAPDAALAVLAGAGLTGTLAPEGLGGLGLPLSHALPVLAAAGRARLALPLDTLLAASHLLDLLPGDAATALVEGRALLTAADVAEVAFAGGRVSGLAGQVALATAADWLIVPEGEAALLFVALDRGGAAAVPDGFATLDPDRAIARVAFDGAPAIRIAAAGAVAEFHARALLFRAVDMIAAARAAQALAADFLSGREQFGQPLIGFQALRHSLARAYMALHGAERLVWQGLTAAPEARPALARMAYARATKAAPEAAEAALHLHGGMGFTWDVPAHRWLRRIRAMLGPRDAAWAAEAIARDLLDGVA